MTDSLKFIVAGCPRSATAYISRLLSNLGLQCGHETFYKFEQRQRKFLEHNSYAGDASWLATPYLKNVPSYVRLMHQTRHPVAVVRSLLQIKFFDTREDGSPVRQGLGLRFTQFAFGHCEELLKYSTSKERAIWFYYYWNKMVEENATGRDLFRFSIENLSTDTLSRMLAHIGTPPDWIADDLLEAHFELLPRNINAKASEKFDDTEDVAWEDLPAQVQELAASYGYGPLTPNAEQVNRWTDAVQSAQQTLRKQAQIVENCRKQQQNKLQLDLSSLQRELRDAEHAGQALRRELGEARQARHATDLYYESANGDPREVAEAKRERDVWMCSAVAGNRVLDADCGDGARARLLAREGFEVTALDPEGRSPMHDSPEDARPERLRFVETALAAYEREPEAYDTVILADLPTRVTRRPRMLEQTLERLAEGGRLIACVPLGHHPDGRRYFCTYGWDFLDLVGKYFDLLDCEIVEGYLGVIGRKPAAGAAPTPPDPQAMSAWVSKAAQALAAMQNRQEHRHKRLEAELEKTRDELASTRAANVRLVCAAPRQSEHKIVMTGQSAVNANVQEGGVLFFCTNGAGLGHLTRALAIARRMRKLDPSLPLYFLSSSPALTLITREDVVAYHIPPQTEFGDKFSYVKWNELLLNTVRMILATHRPTVLVYDGVSPYRGLLNVIDEADFVYSAMVLRLRHKHDRLQNMLTELNVFSEMIFPSEHGAALPEKFYGLRHSIFDPIIYLDREELASREEARERLRLSSDRKAVFVQLGAGNINDTSSWFSRILDLLHRRDDVEVVVAESPISAEPPRLPANVRVLSHYPNSLYFNAFDMAVSAVGYNTFHELMHFGVPSVLIPNQQTITDDQAGRARTAEDAGAARVVLKPADLEEAVNGMLRGDVLKAARQAALKLVPNNSAREVALHVLEKADMRIESELCASKK